MPIKTPITQDKNNTTNAAQIPNETAQEMAALNASFVERNREGLTRAVGYTQVPLLIAALGLSSDVLHAIGYQTDKYLGIDPFKNTGLAFFTVAKSAGFITNNIEKFLYTRLGYYFPKNPAQILFKALPASAKIAYGLRTLFGEGKALTYLPLAGFHMGGGFAVSNLFDHFLGDSIEELTSKQIRGIASTTAFFYKELGQKLAPSAPVRYLASTTAGKAVGSFVTTTFAPAMAPVRIAAGIQFGYDLVSGTINIFVKGSKQANYDYLLGMDAAKKHSSFVARVLTPVLGSYHTAICSGNGAGYIYDGYEALKVAIGLEDKRKTCQYLRNVQHNKYSELVYKHLPVIKETFRNAITFAGIPHPEKEVDVTLWRELVEGGWLENVDTSIFLNAAAFTEQAFPDDFFTGGNFILQFGTFASTMDERGESEWFRKFFDFDILYGYEKELGLGLIPKHQIIKEELIDDFILSLGTSRGWILEKRREKFMSDVATSLVACLGGLPTSNQIAIRDFASELGFIDSDGYPTEEFLPYLTTLTSLSLGADSEEKTEALAKMAERLAKKYNSTGELRFGAAMVAIALHVVSSGNNKRLATLLHTADNILEKHSKDQLLQKALWPVYQTMQNAVVQNLVKQAVTDKIIDGTAKMVKLDIPEELIDVLKDCSVIEQLLAIGKESPRITDICNEDGSIDSIGEKALKKFVESNVKRAEQDFTLKNPDTEIEMIMGREVRRAEADLLLKQLRMQIGIIYLTCLANGELSGESPSKLFATMLANKEYNRIREDMKRAAAFWKISGSPKDYMWRVFADGALNPDGSIKNMESLIEWGLEVKKEHGHRTLADLSDRLEQTKSIVEAYEAAGTVAKKQFKYLSEYLEAAIALKKDEISEYTAQFCAAKKLTPAGYDPLVTFFIDGVNCLDSSAEKIDAIFDDNFDITEAEASDSAKFSLDTLDDLEAALLKLETQLASVKAYESSVNVIFSFDPSYLPSAKGIEIGLKETKRNLQKIEAALQKMDKVINEPEFSKAFKHLKKAFLLD